MKNFFLLLFVIMVFNEAIAQRAVKGDIFGLIEGVSTSQISGDLHAGFKKYGMVGGVFVRRTFRASKRRYFSLQVEAVYKEKGSKYYYTPATDTTRPGTQGYFLRLNYIEVPILLQYSFKKGKDDGLRVEVGPSFGYLVRQQEIMTVPGYNRIVQSPGFNKFEMSYNIGITYILESHFGFNLRFARSLTSLRNYPYYTNLKTFFNPGQQDAVFSLTLFYQFKF